MPKRQKSPYQKPQLRTLSESEAMRRLAKQAAAGNSQAQCMLNAVADESYKPGSGTSTGTKGNLDGSSKD